MLCLKAVSMSGWQVGARATGVLLKHLIAGLSTLLETMVLDQIIRIPNSVAIDLIAAASRNGMTVSAFVEDVLLKYLDADAFTTLQQRGGTLPARPVRGPGPMPGSSVTMTRA